MKQCDFMSVDNLKKTLTLRKKASDGKPISWQTMKWLRISRKLEGYLLFKSSLSEKEGFRKASFKKTKSSSTCSKKATALDRLYDKPRALKVAKVQVLRNLLQFIPTVLRK